jgi:uncharacterized 2Fe-2S/4Fe-4S cluster protein (DUF4445 family)
MINQSDVRNFQLAKAAIAAGIELMCAYAGVNSADLTLLAVAGSLGNALDIAKTESLGIFNNARNIKSVGDSALSGAAQYAVLQKSREYSQKLADIGEYIDLSMNPDFQQALLKNINFPTKR